MRFQHDNYLLGNTDLYSIISYMLQYNCRADSRFAPSQWETSLQSNAISHCLGANLESAL